MKYQCVGCGKECAFGYSKTNKFCSNSCQRQFQFLTETLARFERSEITERKTIRRCLAHIRGYVCEICGIGEYNNKPITLQVDHIDGDPGNHAPANVRLLCPNCHSQTDSFGGKNKGSGRKARGLPLH